MKTIKTVLSLLVAVVALTLASCGSAGQKPLTDDLLRPGQKVEKVTVLDFNATWCIPCKKLYPAFEKAEEKYAGQVYFYTIDFEAYPQTAKAFGIETVPVVVIMLPNGETRRYDGLTDFISDEQLHETAGDAEACTQIIYDNLCRLIDQAK